jgi:hypothetical protein
MFYNLDKFKFLEPLIECKNALLTEYNDYKKILRSSSKYASQLKHLENVENYNLFTSFVMCVFSKHAIGTGQVTNGLFNFSYFMPDRNFMAMETFFAKKFPDLYYNIDSLENSKYFDKTLNLLKEIPNLSQAGFSEYKDSCIFEPHVHEKNIFIFHVLLNPEEFNTMHITSNSVSSKLDSVNDFILFRGSDLHEAKITCKTNMITLGLSFYQS